MFGYEISATSRRGRGEGVEIPAVAFVAITTAWETTKRDAKFFDVATSIVTRCRFETSVRTAATGSAQEELR